MDWKGAVQDIQGACDFLHSKGAEKVGVVGFCMGGALSLAASVLVNGLHASAPFYGIPSKDLADPAKVRTPLQCHFGRKDTLKGFSDPEAQDALEKTLNEVKANYEFFRYDADHAFANDSGPKYDKEACELAHGRVVEFFKKQLH